jgi:hypothetical protein
MQKLYCNKYLKCDRDNNIEVIDCEKGFTFNENLQKCEKSREEENCFDSSAFETDFKNLLGNSTSIKKSLTFFLRNIIVSYFSLGKSFVIKTKYFQNIHLIVQSI